MQSPGYNARSEKALAILKQFYPSDAQSPSAQADYKKIHELLKANNEDHMAALAAFKEWRNGGDAEADCDDACGDHSVTAS